jgi:peptide/nickel transport system substrate-binding protein
MTGQRRARRGAAAAASVLGACLVLAACSGSHTSGSTSSAGSAGGSAGSPPATKAAVLNYQFVGPPLSLNPALNGTSDDSNFTALDYDSLIYQAPNGTFEPDLAASWHYVGTGNKEFELTLRSGVKFSDGSPLTAQAVKNSLDYYRKVIGPEQSLISALTSVTVSGPLTVDLHFSSPVPDAPLLLSAEYEAGAIIGPKGLADPSSLTTSSDGAGQYTYDGAASVTNSAYTYVANPNYWNPSAVHYKKIVIHIIGQPSSVLSALQTGQVAAASGATSTVAQAKSAGMDVVPTPFGTWTLVLDDRAGTVSKPLASLQVRQAINYAIDRSGIVKAVAGGYGVPTDEALGIPGTSAYSNSLANYYSYNVSKAKALMAAAGYANGFTLPVLSESILDANDSIVQAVASDLAQIGITVKLTTVSASLSQFFGDALSKQYPAVFWLTGGGNDAYTSGQSFIPTAGTPLNPMGSTDPQVTSLYNQANAAPVAQQAALYQQLQDRLVKLAWFAPVYQADDIYYMTSSVKNYSSSAVKPTMMLAAPIPTDGWYSS